MLILTQRLSVDSATELIDFTLYLTAEERARSRSRWETPAGEPVYLRLPRGIVLGDRDLLTSEDGSARVLIAAKPEPLLIVTAKTPLDLLRACYHLGNRHVPLEIAPGELLLNPDPVLQSMLEHLGLEVRAAVLPFQPETGAYGHSH